MWVKERARGEVGKGYKISTEQLKKFGEKIEAALRIFNEAAHENVFDYDRIKIVEELDKYLIQYFNRRTFYTNFSIKIKKEK